MRLNTTQLGALITFTQIVSCSSQSFESGTRKSAEKSVEKSDDINVQPSTSPIIILPQIDGSITVEGRTEKELEKPEEIFKSVAEDPAMPEPIETPVVVPANEVGKPQVAADFNSLCAGAQTAKIFSASGGLKSVLGELCNGNIAKPLLTTTLLARAYAGTGTLRFTNLRALNSNSYTDTTSMRFAYAMKLPVPAKDYFDRALPKSLTLVGVKAVVEGPGGSATIKELRRFVKDGPTHERGILVNQVLQKVVEGRGVTVESDNRYDHHIVEDGFSYFATNIVVRPVSSIKTSDMLGMIVRLGDASYLIAVVDTSVGNRGFESIAERELARSVLVGSSALYNRIISSSKP